MPDARRLWLTIAGAIVFLGLTVGAVVFYSLWYIDQASIEDEMARARAALSSMTSEPGFSETTASMALSEIQLLEGARFGSPSEVGADEVAVADGLTDGRVLIWTPQRMGAELFSKLAPLRLATSAIMLIIVLFVAHRLYLVAKELEARRRESHGQARRDPLTGLGNRLAFDERLAQELASGTSEMALLYLDLNGFKQVNDTLGHGAGDDVLRTVAERLAGFATSTDKVMRIGGDEFVVLRTGPESGKDVAAFAREILAAIDQPMLLGATPVQVGASIGIALCPTDGSTDKELVEAADASLYRAKRARTGIEKVSVA